MPNIIVKPPGSEGAYTPYGGSRIFMTAKDHQIFLYGGTNTGKTLSCCYKMLLLCLKYPGCKFLFTRNSYTALINSGVETFERVLSMCGYEVGKKPHQIKKLGESKPTKYLFPYMKRDGVDADGISPRTYEGRSSIILASLDNAKDQLGAEYDFVYVNQPEQSTEDDWQYVCSRADGRYNHAPYPQIFGDPNPEHAQHWIKKGGWEAEAGESSEDGKWRMIKSRYQDNPVIWDMKKNKFTPEGEKQVGRKLQSYSSVMIKRLIEGEWASYEGLVYSEAWDRKRHVLSIDKLNELYPNYEEWDSYWAIDFGLDDPFVWSELRKHPDKNLFIRTRLIYMSNRTILEQADTIKRVTMGQNPPKLIVADRNPQEIRLLENALGYHIVSARKGPASVKARINLLTEMLKNDELKFVQVDDALVEKDKRLEEKKLPISFEQEVEVIRWRDNTRLVNDTPMDGDDHEENCLGYLLLHLKAENHIIKAVWI
jgi:hypothetical protein